MVQLLLLLPLPAAAADMPACPFRDCFLVKARMGLLRALDDLWQLTGSFVDSVLGGAQQPAPQQLTEEGVAALNKSFGNALRRRGGGHLCIGSQTAGSV